MQSNNATSLSGLPAALAAAGIILLAGCASTGGNTSGSAPAPAPISRIGFLSDYDKLSLAPGSDSTLCWRTSDVDWKKYDKVLIERIVVSVKEDAKHKSVDPTDLKALTDYYHGALVAALKPELQEVSQAGPGVLRVRIAITDLVPTDVTQSLVGTAIPYGFVGEMAAGTATGRPAGSTPYLGETGMQMQVRDGASGAVIGECADRNVGRKYVADLDKGVPNAAEKWANGYVDSFSSWNYARRAFDTWSAFFAQRLRALRVG